jgi:hypothetical protein
MEYATLKWQKVEKWRIEEYSSNMATSVKLNDEFVLRARKIAQIEHRTLPSQIEFYFKIALAAEENPDLSFHAVKEIMAAREDQDTEEFSWS